MIILICQSKGDIKQKMMKIVNRTLIEISINLKLV